MNINITWPEGTKVKEVFKDINNDILIELDTGTKHWSDTIYFWESIKNKEFNLLSKSQFEYLERIEEACLNFEEF